MRIIGGELRGRRLAATSRRTAGVRPTADRVREAMFASFGTSGGRASSTSFCGSGALGIEALSRGAGRGILVDTRRRPRRRNVRELGLAARGKEVVRSDARATCGGPGRRST